MRQIMKRIEPTQIDPYDDGLTRYGFWGAVILLAAFLIEVAFSRSSAHPTPRHARR